MSALLLRLSVGPTHIETRQQKGREEGARKMAKGIYKKVTAVGRATTFAVGLAVMLALTVGLASTALAGTGVGARFELGQTNTVNAITKLVGSVAGPSLQVDNNSTDANATALDLQVEPGKAPMKVNSYAQVANLNSDKLDGKSANEIGINGLEYVSASSASNSNSAKGVHLDCPANKLPVTYGYRIDGGNGGSYPNLVSDVTIHQVDIGRYGVSVSAVEDKPTSANWSLTVEASCATAS